MYQRGNAFLEVNVPPKIIDSDARPLSLWKKARGILGLSRSATPQENPMKHAAAIAQLEVSAQVCETNAPINEAEGNHEQAKLERDNAAAYRVAIAHLKADQ